MSTSLLATQYPKVNAQAAARPRRRRIIMFANDASHFRRV